MSRRRTSVLTLVVAAAAVSTAVVGTVTEPSHADESARVAESTLSIRVPHSRIEAGATTKVRGGLHIRGTAEGGRPHGDARGPARGQPRLHPRGDVGGRPARRGQPRRAADGHHPLPVDVRRRGGRPAQQERRRPRRDRGGAAPRPPDPDQPVHPGRPPRRGTGRKRPRTRPSAHPRHRPAASDRLPPQPGRRPADLAGHRPGPDRSPWRGGVPGAARRRGRRTGCGSTAPRSSIPRTAASCGSASGRW